MFVTKKLIKAKRDMWAAEKDKNKYMLLKEHFLSMYYEERKKYDKSFLANLTLKQRLKLHKLLIAVIQVNNRIHGRKCKVLFDKRTSTDKPKIFAITHIGKFDIEMVAALVKEHFTVLTGDFEGLAGTMDGKLIQAHGVVYFNQIVKSDRISAAERMVDILKKSGNLMYFPEGTWNLSPNLPMLPLNWGIIRVAKQGSAEIIPVAVDQYEDKRFVACIGSNFSVDKYGENDYEIIRAADDLRDRMASLKYSIWENEKLIERSLLKDSYWKDYIASRLAEWYFSERGINRLMFRPKNVITYDEAFEHLKTIEIGYNTAFLYNKRIK